MIKTRVASVIDITSVCKDNSFARIQRRDNLCIGFGAYDRGQHTHQREMTLYTLLGVLLLYHKYYRFSTIFKLIKPEYNLQRVSLFSTFFSL